MPDRCTKVQDLGLFDRPCRGSQREAYQFVRKRSRIIDTDKRTTGDADQMELVDAKHLNESTQIAALCSWLFASNGIGDTVAPATSIIGNDTVSGVGEGIDLVLPVTACSG